MPSEALPRCEFEGKDLLVKVDLQLAGDVNAIAPVVSKVMAIVTEMGCAVGHEFEIELALREALANAIEHGVGHDASSARSPATTSAASTSSTNSWTTSASRRAAPRSTCARTRQVPESSVP